MNFGRVSGDRDTEISRVQTLQLELLDQDQVQGVVVKVVQRLKVKVAIAMSMLHPERLPSKRWVRTLLSCVT